MTENREDFVKQIHALFEDKVGTKTTETDAFMDRVGEKTVEIFNAVVLGSNRETTNPIDFKNFQKYADGLTDEDVAALEAETEASIQQFNDDIQARNDAMNAVRSIIDKALELNDSNALVELVKDVLENTDEPKSVYEDQFRRSVLSRFGITIPNPEHIVHDYIWKHNRELHGTTQEGSEYLVVDGFIDNEKLAVDAMQSTNPEEPGRHTNSFAFSSKDVIKQSNPKDAVGVKKIAFSTVPSTVIAEIALGMTEGARKYGRHNYRGVGVRYSVYYDATLRHLMKWWEGEDLDPDSGLSHITKALTSLVVLRDAMINGKYSDDRPPRIPEEFWNDLQTKVDELFVKYPTSVDPYTEVKN